MKKNLCLIHTTVKHLISSPPMAFIQDTNMEWGVMGSFWLPQYTMKMSYSILWFSFYSTFTQQSSYIELVL